jgi:hypothetical protein
MSVHEHRNGVPINSCLCLPSLIVLSGVILSNKPLDHKRYQGYLVEDFMVHYVLYSSTRHTPSGLLLSNPGNIPQRSSYYLSGLRQQWGKLAALA